MTAFPGTIFSSILKILCDFLVIFRDIYRKFFLKSDAWTMEQIRMRAEADH